MFWKKSILTKMLLGIILPILLVLSFAGVFILQQVQQSLTTLTENELSAQSESASFQVSEFFTKYMELVRQMGCNESVVQLLRDMTEAGTAKDIPAYAMAAKSMDSILASDSNISLVWSADFDSGESVRSGGVVRGKNTDYDITSRSWYQQTLDSKQLFITEPYTDSTTGKLVASVISPVYNGSQMIGLVAIDLTVDALKTMMDEQKLGETGFFVLATATGSIIHHPDEAMLGETIENAQLSANAVKAVQSKAVGNYTYESAGVECHGYLSGVGQTGWVVLSGLPSQEFFSSYNAIRIQIFLVFGVGLLIILVILVLIASGIVRPLKKLAVVAHSIADGDLNVAVDTTSVDETGRVAVAMQRTVTRLKDYINYIDEISKVLNEVASGNLVFELTYDYAGEFSKIKEALNHISSSLNDTMGEINRASHEVSIGADQVSDGAQELSQGATEQASSIEELAATINEISGQIQQTAEFAQQAKLTSAGATNEIAGSNRKMQDMIAAMSQISAKSSQIGKIIKTIEDIAFQTNILALNAAVEAARAGAAGKGFAVVADEVRNLASKSAEAAKNTTALIGETVAAVQNGTAIADDTAASMLKVVNSSTEVTELIEAISKASDGQAVSTKQVTQGIDQISSVVQNNSATAEQSAAASEELSGQAQVLGNLVGRFTLRDDSVKM